VIVDVHGHFLDLGFRSGLPLNASLGGVTDVPMLRAGGVGAQLCVNWTPDVALSGPHSHSVPSPVTCRRYDDRSPIFVENHPPVADTKPHAVASLETFHIAMPGCRKLRQPLIDPTTHVGRELRPLASAGRGEDDRVAGGELDVLDLERAGAEEAGGDAAHVG
jgi:hypothetical protein